jgi:hypothetical protein
VTIAGRAVGPDGEPIREGVAVCRTIVHPLHGQVPRTLPIRDGRFELPGCVPGRSYPVLLFDATHALAAVAEVQVPTSGAPPPIRLVPCGTADVRLLDTAGRPLAGQRPRVYFWLAFDRPAGQPADDRQRSDPIVQSWIDSPHYLPGPLTDAAGTASLPALIPGLEYKVGFLIGGREQLTGPFRVDPGQTARPLVVEVPPEETGEP